MDTFVQEGQLSDTIGQDIIIELHCLLEYFRIRQESNLSTTLLCFSFFLYLIESYPSLIFLFPDFPITEHGSRKVSRKGIHHGHPYTMQTTRYFIGTFVKLSSSSYLGHNHLKGGYSFFLVYIHRDTTPIILHCH